MRGKKEGDSGRAKIGIEKGGAVSGRGEREEKEKLGKERELREEQIKGRETCGEEGGREERERK